MASLDPRLLLLSDADNVLVVRGAIDVGDEVRLEKETVTATVRTGLGHKLARRHIGKGRKIIKYGAPIGSATADIAPGAHVHIHNVKSDYTPTYALAAAEEALK